MMQHQNCYGWIQPLAARVRSPLLLHCCFLFRLHRNPSKKTFVSSYICIEWASAVQAQGHTHNTYIKTCTCLRIAWNIATSWSSQKLSCSCLPFLIASVMFTFDNRAWAGPRYPQVFPRQARGPWSRPGGMSGSDKIRRGPASPGVRNPPESARKRRAASPQGCNP